MADGGLLAALFLALAFQEIRFEGFEAEKLGLLSICVSMIIGGWFLQRRRREHARCHRAPDSLRKAA